MEIDDDFNAPWAESVTCPKCRQKFEVSYSLTGTNKSYQLICEDCEPTGSD